MGFNRINMGSGLEGGMCRVRIGFEASKTGLNWALSSFRREDIEAPDFQLEATWIANDCP